MKKHSNVSVNLQHSIDHGQKVVTAFDTVAPIYDQSFNELPVVQRLRAKVYDAILTRIPPASSILDINCGTGIDALYLAGKGMTVTGIDISPNMIEQCNEKSRLLQSDNTLFHVASFEDFRPIVKKEFDLVLSNFGGLNCVKNIGNVATQVSASVKPNGYFIATVMPSIALWEILSGVFRAKWRYAFRRFYNNTPATGFNDQSFKVFYHSPRYFYSFFHPCFTVEQIIGLNIFSPPPSATGFIQRHPRLTTLLTRLDEFIESFPLIRSMGDHYMMVMKRKSL